MTGKPTNSGRTVLCVEDEELQLKVRCMLLQGAGYNVLNAQTGMEALALFQSHDIDVVVMDYSLSDKDGVAVAEEMKHIRPGTPIVILSGLSSAVPDGSIVDLWLRKADVAPEDFLMQVRKVIEGRGEKLTGFRSLNEDTGQ